VKENQKIKQAKHEREQRFMEQLRRHPELMERLEAIIGIAEADGEKLPTADEIEDRLVEEVRRLGHQVMEDWADRAEVRVGEEFQQSRPEGRIAKKKP
jgi:hypothetical protein